MLLEKGSRLVMIGDSVTDCGRNYQAAPAAWDSYGDGYVRLVNAVLTGLAPEQKIMVVNKGVNGDTIRHLKARWKQDVTALHPDYLSVMIGINDVWRQFDGELQQLETVSPAEYEQTYCELLEQTKPQVKNIFIFSPFFMELNRSDPMRRRVDEYAAIARRIAEKFGLPYIDVQKRIDRYLQSLSYFYISADRVHPNLQGHMILAKAFLDTVEFDWKER
ncbi:MULTISPECIES: SGNH/GDSL hydrolase family protein [Caproicibacterium]|uniref:SGNH/GDSL hydrolase family protein n=1 Tax=Caproicibacterium argilliputei TaxID=3030016 RepID=A0AA97D944_9FIRM|nr:SGNH/GDSL hydrolase family protein [Caproicibacterium argilliputei]WOC32855.1 SGNH/GDSL hydrolase family protein [Caproicibacterium argilliputei]